MSSGRIAARLRKTRFLRAYISNGTATQFLKYVFTGFTAALVEYLSFYFLYRLTGQQVILSNSVAMTLGFLLSFSLNRKWSFRSEGSLFRQFFLYGALFGVNLAISNVLMHLLIAKLGFAPFVSKALVIGLLVLWNFNIYRKVIFRNKNDGNKKQ